MRSRPKYYKLIDRRPVPVHDVIEWARWRESVGFDGNRVAISEIGPLTVSTVFLGIDHQWSPDPAAPPILFETMIFGGEPKIALGRLLEHIDLDYQERYATWDEAEAGHQRAIEWAKERLAEADASLKFKSSTEQ